jgi:UDP-N-acetylmuramate--alanine ligase
MNPTLENIKYAYFIGIGGIGMSAIARFFMDSGVAVYGYDKTRTLLCEQLEEEGMILHYEGAVAEIPAVFLSESTQAIVVYTPAIPSDFVEFQYFKSNNIPMFKRAFVLGLISRSYYTIAIAGTHGKTTTSALMAKILADLGLVFSAFLGGISTDFGSNYIRMSEGKMPFGKPIMLVEADEFDRSFLQLSPSVAIITSTDADHLDIYGDDSEVKNGFQAFAQKIAPKGLLVLNENALITKPKGLESRIYGFGADCDYRLGLCKYAGGLFTFTWGYGQGEEAVVLGLPGIHNAENASAVLTVIKELGLDTSIAIKSVRSFLGVKRRFEKVFESSDKLVIDDYAHHPTEINALLDSLSLMYPTKEITCVFQPHLFSRTRDFLDAFAAAISKAKKSIILPIYPAREKPIEGVKSEVLAAKIKGCLGVFSTKEILDYIEREKPELLVITGAGDIDKLPNEIRRIYESDR